MFTNNKYSLSFPTLKSCTGFFLTYLYHAYKHLFSFLQNCSITLYKRSNDGVTQKKAMNKERNEKMNGNKKHEVKYASQ